MDHTYEYSKIQSTHSYKFTELNIELNISPAEYTYADADESLNMYLIDIINKNEKKKGRVNLGNATGKILHDFICENPECAVGYFPSDEGNSYLAREKLFKDWEESANTEDILKVENEIKVVDESMNIRFYFHKEGYPNKTELIMHLEFIKKGFESVNKLYL